MHCLSVPAGGPVWHVGSVCSNMAEALFAIQTVQMAADELGLAA